MWESIDSDVAMMPVKCQVSLLRLAALAIALSACENYSLKSPDSSLSTAVVETPSGDENIARTTGHSPVLTFVGQAALFEQAQLNDPRFGGVVSVTLEAEYHSASDKRCRRFRIRAPSTPPEGRSHFACAANGDWELVDIHASKP